MKLVVTGAAGFIGSNFVRYAMQAQPEWFVVAVDKLTYAGNLKNLAEVLTNSRVQFVRLDVCDPAIVDPLRGADAVIHFAAESHVDRSIEDAIPFVRTNVEGTQRLVEACRSVGVARFVQISTDEVYGSLHAPGSTFSEKSPLAPNSPYAATKAAADLIVASYVRTHGFPAIITRCSNNYGPFQFPEKFVPLMICRALAGRPLPIYGDGLHVRDWIHVLDHCRALHAVLCFGKEGETYNIGGECELRNLDVAQRILGLAGRPHSLIQFVADRPGHDRRYAMDCRKLKETLEWQCTLDFETGLRQTVQWYAQNEGWLNEIRSKEYTEYFARHYVHRDRFLAGAKAQASGSLT